MRIEYEVKLGFKDVMIRPKRSTLKSRSQVELNRTFRFRNAGFEWTGIPVMAANMDTVGTFSMAAVLGDQGLVTAVHKHYSPEEWADFVSRSDERILDHIMVSTGTGEADLVKLRRILRENDSLRLTVVGIFIGGLFAYVAILLLAVAKGKAEGNLDERDRRILGQASTAQSALILLSLAAWMIYLAEKFRDAGAVPVVYLYLIFGSVVIVNIIGQAVGILLGYWRLARYGEG